MTAGVLDNPVVPALWSVLPFVFFLLALAVLPLAAPGFWHRHYGKVALGIGLPTFLWFACGRGVECPFWRSQYHDTALEYATFILLLTSLYVTTSGIFLRGNLPGTPASNAAILAGGALLASFVGTTGAAMLLVRPLLRANRWRGDRTLPVLFFIFSVCNIGGCLTPLGDPPLFLGFLKGVPFGWTFRLFPEWLVMNAILLAVFYAWDLRSFRREAAEGRSPPAPLTDERLALVGMLNVVLVLAVLGTVLLQGTFRLECPDGPAPLPWGVQEGAFLLLILLSLRFTDPEIRKANHFTWHPIQEVAILFAAIFATMAPALVLLKAKAPAFGLTEPWQFFWATGALSAVLDNAPTYLTFLSVAQGLGGTGPLVAGVRPDLLAAISCGAVFMGALTYIGNAPNFMVRSIAEESGVRMPSFFRYCAYSAAVLLPLFLLVTLLCFR